MRKIIMFLLLAMVIQLSATYISAGNDPTVRHIPKFGGELWFVNDGMASSGDGTTPDEAFKTIGMWLTHVVYLEAINEYISKGGKSRGSFIILDKEGNNIHNIFGDEFKYDMNKSGSFTDSNILEVFLDNDLNFNKKWVSPRPIPKEEHWFENIWKEFRNNNVIR